ncbi:hypothetical protein L195_g062582, partial [Trifolium pratense]
MRELYLDSPINSNVDANAGAPGSSKKTLMFDTNSENL